MNTAICDRASECNHLPDGCTNEIREETLIQRQRKDDHRSTFERVVERDRNLIFACFALVVCLNFTEGRYLLYPFKIFSTFVHELCHAIAALLVGGSVEKLYIYPDGSGLAFTAFTETQGEWRQAFVAAGGYPGTAVTGCILLLFRRTTLGPTIGVLGFGVVICLSCLLWVRNPFGLVALIIEGVALLICGWNLPAHILDNLYSFLAAACCLNAVQSIQALFGDHEYYAGGRVITQTDAHTVADYWGGDFRFWASIWFCWSIGLTAAGILFARDAGPLPRRFCIQASKTENTGRSSNKDYTAPSVTTTPAVASSSRNQHVEV
jgi:Peptidase M50B-like